MRLPLTISFVLWIGTAIADEVRILVQNSPLAGSQYYALAEIWPRLKAGDALVLVREPDNRHDPNAIRVEWQGRKLGYLPRAENRHLAEAMDRGDRLAARIARLRPDPDPWRRLEVDIYLSSKPGTG